MQRRIVIKLEDPVPMGRSTWLKLVTDSGHVFEYKGKPRLVKQIEKNCWVFEKAPDFSHPPSPIGIPIRRKKKPIPQGVKAAVWNKYIGKGVGSALCPICRTNEITPFDFHAAHVVPEAKGGEISVTNLRPTCASCNLSCGTRNLFEFAKLFDTGPKNG